MKFKGNRKPIPLAKPIIGKVERRMVNQVLKTGQLAQGKLVAQFEDNFSMQLENRDCVAVNSGTSALHLALLGLGIGEGDEVIVPSFTFAATANAVALTGAKPIFVDISIENFNIDFLLIEKQITNKTKAIIVVHLFGLPACMPEILTIARKHNLLVVEDAAQAHLASINAKLVGTFGDAAAFSFYPTKNMTTGEGGLISLKDSSVARTCRLLRNQGMEKRYQNEIVGFNLRMTEIHAAIGIAQLRKIADWTRARQENALFLTEHIERLATPKVPDGYSHVFHQFTLRIPKYRDQFKERLQASGIGCDVYYPTQVHKLRAFESDLKLPSTALATQEVLSIPVHPSLKKNQLKRIASEINMISEQLNC